MKNYTKFTAHFQDYIRSKEKGLTESFVEPDEKWSKRIITSLNQCKIFELTENMKKLLALTKPPKTNEKVHLPFPATFVDVCFRKKELSDLGIDIEYEEIIGILITERRMMIPKEDHNEERAITEEDKKDGRLVGRLISFDFFCKAYVKGEMYDTFIVFLADTELNEEYEGKIKVSNTYIDKKTRNFLHLFVLSLLNLLQDPNVIILHTEADKQRNIKRIKRGKMAIPGRMVIKLTGDLKIYMNNVNSNKGLWSYSHKFWVRGHYRTLRHPKWGDKVGHRTWILPYVKGQGILIDKRYKIEGR